MPKTYDEMMDEYKRALAIYEIDYPNYCRTCGGAGSITHTENGTPRGAGNWPMDVSEECDDCAGQGKCPRCAYQIETVIWESMCWMCWSDDPKYCPACGLNLMKTQTLAPQPPDYDPPLEVRKVGKEEPERRVGGWLLPDEFLPEVMDDIAKKSILRPLTLVPQQRTQSLPECGPMEIETLGPSDILKIRCWHMISKVVHSLWRKRFDPSDG